MDGVKLFNVVVTHLSLFIPGFFIHSMKKTCPNILLGMVPSNKHVFTCKADASIISLKVCAVLPQAPCYEFGISSIELLKICNF